MTSREVFGVHAGGEGGRTHQVREHHGDLAALCVSAWSGSRDLRRNGCLSGTKRSNGPQQLEPRPKR